MVEGKKNKTLSSVGRVGREGNMGQDARINAPAQVGDSSHRGLGPSPSPSPSPSSSVNSNPSEASSLQIKIAEAILQPLLNCEHGYMMRQVVKAPVDSGNFQRQRSNGDGERGYVFVVKKDTPLVIAAKIEPYVRWSLKIWRRKKMKKGGLKNMKKRKLRGDHLEDKVELLGRGNDRPIIKRTYKRRMGREVLVG